MLTAIRPPPARNPAPERCVAMLVSGGLEHAGGIGRWAGYLTESWVRQGLYPRCEIIDTRGHGHAGIAALAFAWTLIRLLQLRLQNRLSLIHANLSVGGSTARKSIVTLLAGMMGVPVVLHLHGAEYDEFYKRSSRIVQLVIRGMFARARHIIVLGEKEAAWIASALEVPRGKITILHNGVRRPAVAARVAQVPAGQCRIVFLGRLGQRKGVPELIDALSSQALRGRHWTATLAGDGNIEEYRHLVESRGLAGRISLPGWIDQAAAAALIQSSDVLTLPSWAENFPIAVIEALAHGVPVVTTPVGVTPELLTDGASVLFVPPGNAAALAEALIRLIDDPKLRRDIGTAGRDVFAAELDIDMLARQLADLHRGLLAAASPQAVLVKDW